MWGKGLIKFLGHEVTVGALVYPNHSITRQEAAAFERSQCTNNDLNHAVVVRERSGNGYAVIRLNSVQTAFGSVKLYAVLSKIQHPDVT